MEPDHQVLSGMLETAVVAARLAGQHAIEQLNYLKPSLKTSTDFVTNADTQCQKIIIDRIKQSYPDDGLLAEEGGDKSLFKQPPRSARPVWWIIDPIDGTANLVHRIPCFTVSIAAIWAGRPVVAAVFDPSTDSMFTAVNGGQAQNNSRRITSGTETLSQLSSVGIDSFYNEGVPDWVCHVIQRTRSRNFGTTALHLAYVAQGSLVAAAAARPKLWDIAAGVLLAEAAGATVTDWEGKAIFPLDVAAYEGGELPTLAANPTVHGEMLKLLYK